MTSRRRRTLRRAARDHRALPASRARRCCRCCTSCRREGLRHPRGHRGLRRDPRPQRRRGVRRRDLLHDVQAPARRRLPRRRLHQHAVRGHGRRRDLRAAQGPPRRRQRRDHRRRQGHARAHRVQRRLRLRAGRDGQLGVLRQPDPARAPPSWSTTCAPAGGPRPPAGPRSAPCARSSGCSPASTTAWPTRAPPPGPALAGSACELAHESRRGRPTRLGPERRGSAEATASADRGGRRATSTPVLSAHWDDRRPVDPRGLRSVRRLPGAAQALGDDARRAHPAGQGLRAARPRRRGLPDRHEVGLHPAGRRQAALPRRQRRRVRAGHLQGHPADDGQPAHARRGRDHRRRTRSARNTAFIYVRGEVAPRRSAGCSAAVARGVRRRLPRQGHPRLRLRPRRRRARRRRGLHLRRGDGAARLARGPPRPAAAAPAVPRRRRPLRLPDGRQQRRVDRARPVDRRATAPTGSPSMGTEKSQGLRRSTRCPGHVTQPRPVRSAARHHAARAARPRRRRPRGPRAEVLDARRLVDAAAHRRAPRRAARLRGRRRGRARCSAPRRCRSSTRPPAWCARCCAGPSSTSTSPAASARRAARARTGWCRSSHRLEHGEGTEDDLDKLLDLCDNILGRVVLRPRRRRDQPDHVVDPVLPRRVRRRTSTHGGCPFDPVASTVFATAGAHA